MKVMLNAFLLLNVLNISIASHHWQSPKSSHKFPKYPFCGAIPQRTTGTHQQASLPSCAPGRSPNQLSALPPKGLCTYCFPAWEKLLVSPKDTQDPHSLIPLLKWHLLPYPPDRSDSVPTPFTVSRWPAFPFHSLPWPCVSTQPYTLPVSTPLPRTHAPSSTHLSISTCLFLYWPPPWAPKRFTVKKRRKES